MYDNFPYSNFHDLNTDWLVKRVANVETSEANAKASEESSAQSATESALSADQAHASELNAQASAEASAQSATASAESATEANNYVASTRNQVNLLQSRVDNIIPSGTQTEGNTELIDIRTAFNGLIYANAGNAVRAQAEELNTSIDQIANFQNVRLNNAFTACDIDASGVETVRTDNKVFCSDYIEQKNLVNIKVNTGYNMTVFYYDSGKTFISYIARYAGTYPIDKGNGYIRLKAVKGSYQVFNAVEASNDSHELYTNNPVSTAISKNRIKSDNVIIGAIHDGNYIDVNGQLLPASGDWGYTDFSPIESETVYYLYSFARKNKIISNSYINFYDADKAWISGIQKYNDTPITTPPNSCYVRISCPWVELRYIYLTSSSVAPMWYKRYGQDSLINTLSKYQRNSYANVLSIAKDGINTLAEHNDFPIYPHCSKYSYISAIYEGFDGLLMHIIKTSDNQFVICHENNIYGLAKNDDGSALANPYNISTHTLAELKAVDMGYDYGSMYRGTRIMTLQEGLKLAKALNVYLVIEPSGLSQSDYATIAGIIKSYGYIKNVGVHSYYANNLREVKNVIPQAMLLLDATGTAQYINSIISDAIGLKTDFNTVCVGKIANLNNNMTEELVQRMIDNNISYFIANPTSEPDGFIQYMEQSPLASYVTFVNSQCIPANKMLLDNII